MLAGYSVDEGTEEIGSREHGKYSAVRRKKGRNLPAKQEATGFALLMAWCFGRLRRSFTAT